MQNLTEKIIQLLNERNIKFEHSFHEITQSSKESALARKRELSLGAKSLLFKDKKNFRLLTLRADRDVDNNKVRKILKSQKLRFATNEELWELASVKKGALPPFTLPFLNIDHYVDISMLDFDEMAFNPGSLDQSIIMKTNDWLEMIQAKFCSFSL